MHLDLTTEQVLAARSEIHGVALDVYNELFRMTWGASHVRFVEVVPSSTASLALLVARVLARSPLEDFSDDDWLPNVKFQLSPSDVVVNLITMAADEMAHELRWPNDLLATALARVQISTGELCWEIVADEAAGRPAAPYRYGPTHQVVWGSAERLYFLQVHQES